jgi:hypothetical protein
MDMPKVALLALIGVLGCAGLPAAAEDAAGTVPAKRLAPGHQPALSDPAKAAAVQAGASPRAKGGPNAPAAMAVRAAQAAATPSELRLASRAIATGSDQVPSTAVVQAGAAAQAKPTLNAPAALIMRAGQAAAMASVLPNKPPPSSNVATHAGARLDAKPSAAVIVGAQAALARPEHLDAIQQGARYSSDISPSDASPGGSAKAAAVRGTEVDGLVLRSANSSGMSARSPTRIAILDTPPLKLKRAALGGVNRARRR